VGDHDFSKAGLKFVREMEARVRDLLGSPPHTYEREDKGHGGWSVRKRKKNSQRKIGQSRNTSSERARKKASRPLKPSQTMGRKGGRWQRVGVCIKAAIEACLGGKKGKLARGEDFYRGTEKIGKVKL